MPRLYLPIPPRTRFKKGLPRLISIRSEMGLDHLMMFFIHFPTIARRNEGELLRSGLSTRKTTIRSDWALRRFLHVCLASVLAVAWGWSQPTTGLAQSTTTEWLEFRGNLQNGVAPTGDMVTHWGEGENVKWFVETQGLGWSSPVIARNRIYYTTAVPDPAAGTDDPLAGPQTLCLECRDANSGALIFLKTIFEQSEDAPLVHKKNSHASPTPILSDDHVYIHFGHQGTVCTDLSGEIIWVNQDHAYPPVHGNGGSPILVDGKLIIACDGGSDAYTVALNAATGQEVWRTPRDAKGPETFSFCTPQCIEVDGQKQIISPGSNIVQSLNPENGAVWWFVRYEGFSVVPRPVYHQGLVCISTGYTAPLVLAIDPTGSGDVTESHLRWKYKGAAPNTPSFVPFENQIIMVSDSGIAASVDMASGKEVWKKRIGGNYSSSPTIWRNYVFFQSEEGTASVVQLDRKPIDVSKNQLPGRIFASYAVLENDWIIRTEKGLYRIGKLQ